MGAFLGAVFSGPLARVSRQGLAVLIAVAVWGITIAAFGFTRTLWVGLVLLAAAGAADMVSAVFRSTMLQTATPDALRGRLQGVFVVVVAGGPRLGDVESGVVATATNETISIVSGGLLCVLGVIILGMLVPSFARYRAPSGPVSDAALLAGLDAAEDELAGEGLEPRAQADLPSDQGPTTGAPSGEPSARPHC